MMVEIFKNRTEQFWDTELDLEAWQKLYYKHQQDYIRKRLSAIKYIHEGKSRLQVCSLIGCRYNTLTSWIDKYLDGGLQGLVEPIKQLICSPTSQPRAKTRVETDNSGAISKGSMAFLGIYGLEKSLSSVLQMKWNVVLKSSRVYEILDELGLSYQRAHRDYANADQAEQKAFVEVLKKTGNEAGEGKNPLLR